MTQATVYAQQKKIKQRKKNCESESDKRTERHLRFSSSVTDPLCVRFIFPPIGIYIIYVYTFKNENDARETERGKIWKEI